MATHDDQHLSVRARGNADDRSGFKRFDLAIVCDLFERIGRDQLNVCFQGAISIAELWRQGFQAFPIPAARIDFRPLKCAVLHFGLKAEHTLASSFVLFRFYT